MDQIIIFVTVLMATFAGLLITLRLGKEYVYVYFGALGVLIAFLLSTALDIFGWPILMAEIFYAAFFLSTDTVSEYIGKKDAKKLIWILLASFVGTVLLMRFILGVNLSMIDDPAFAAHSTLFAAIPLTMLPIVAGIMFFEQRLDIYLFTKMKELTEGRFLWLRNIASTSIVQGIDVLLVYPIFFYPIFGPDTWKLMVAAYIMKVSVALFDTPFLYVAKYFLPKRI